MRSAFPVSTLRVSWLDLPIVSQSWMLRTMTYVLRNAHCCPKLILSWFPQDTQLKSDGGLVRVVPDPLKQTTPAEAWLCPLSARAPDASTPEANRGSTP